MGGGLLTVQTALNLAYNECYWTAEFGERCRLFGELTVAVLIAREFPRLARRAVFRTDMRKAGGEAMRRKAAPPPAREADGQFSLNGLNRPPEIDVNRAAGRSIVGRDRRTEAAKASHGLVGQGQGQG